MTGTACLGTKTVRSPTEPTEGFVEADDDGKPEESVEIVGDTTSTVSSEAELTEGFVEPSEYEFSISSLGEESVERRIKSPSTFGFDDGDTNFMASSKTEMPEGFVEPSEYEFSISWGRSRSRGALDLLPPSAPMIKALIP